jgi:hypothetical protein
MSLKLINGGKYIKLTKPLGIYSNTKSILILINLIVGYFFIRYFTHSFYKTRKILNI